MKRLLVWTLLFAGLALAGAPVEIRFTAGGPDPSRLHVPTDQPYTLILINQTDEPVRLFFDQKKELSPPEQAFAARFLAKGPLVVPAAGRLELEYWPTQTGILHLRVTEGSARFLLELILEPPEYYEGPSGCS
ncbi:hypothetical protein [Oceanithermus sp.]|uniref:hypothetical protein n=1 Tax=Oceanithermus sp. TaxID=2268145 RepID=UPI00257E0866|nr:hypothetical protein [Oceanithermus sp.]